VKFPTSLESRIAQEPDPEIRDMMMTAHTTGINITSVRVLGRNFKCVFIGRKYVAFGNISKFIRFKIYEHIGDRMAFHLRTNAFLFTRA